MTSAAQPERLKVLIVDDEPLARERLRVLLDRIGGTEVIGEAADGAAALREIARLQPGLVILDVQMPGLDGLRVLEALDDPPPVILSTAFEHHAVRAFDLDVVDYLLKPYSADRLRRAVERARRSLLAEGPAAVPAPGGVVPRLTAQDGRANVIVDAAQLDLIVLEAGVVFLHQRSGPTLLSSQTMQELEELLEPAGFCRVSRQAIVRLGAVQSWTPAGDGGIDLTLAGGRRVEVSRRRGRRVRTLLG